MCQDCTRLHEQLQQQSEEMFGLRRRIRNLTRDLKAERRKLEHLRGKKSDKQHVRKGQKRSRFGRI
jgi:phage shock protein A